MQWGAVASSPGLTAEQRMESFGISKAGLVAGVGFDIVAYSFILMFLIS
jgi:hypothetical protein